VRPVAVLEASGRTIVVCNIVDAVTLPVASFIAQKLGLATAYGADPSDRARIGRHLSRAAVRRLARAAAAEQRLPSLRYRLLGLALGIGAIAIAMAKAVTRRGGWAKWLWLGLFMTGLGALKGRICLPVAWVAQQLGVTGADPIAWENIRRSWVINDDTIMLRPDPRTELFWMVGTFTVKAVRDSEGRVLAWRGEDIYDFHPQQGQQVDPRHHFCWAWSGVDANDVAVILPGRVARWVRRIAHHIFPRVWGKMVRLQPVGKDRFKVLISNRLWPALGGKPFTTVVEVPLGG